MNFMHSNSHQTKWEPQDQDLSESDLLPNYAPSTRECYSNNHGQPYQHDINAFESEDYEQDSEQDWKQREHLNQHTFHSIDRPIMYNSHGQGNNASNYSGQNNSNNPAEDPHYRVHEELDLMMANELGLTPRPQLNAYNASYTYNSNANMAPYQYYSQTTAYHSYQGIQSPDAIGTDSASMNSNSPMMQRPQHANTPQSMHDPRFSNSPQYMQGSPYTYSPHAMQGIQYPNTALPPSPASTGRRDSYQHVRPQPSTEPQGTQETRSAGTGFTPLPSFESIRSPIIPTGSEGEVDVDGDGDGDGDEESEIESEVESEPPQKSRKSLPAAKPSTTKTSTTKASSAKASIAKATAAKVSTPATKKHHNEVEKSYRVRLNNCIDELSVTIFGAPRENETNRNRSSATVYKHPKALVIATAKGNIEDLRSKNAKLAEEVAELKRKLAIYEHNSKPPPGPPSGGGPSPGDNRNGNGNSMRV